MSKKIYLSPSNQDRCVTAPDDSRGSLHCVTLLAFPETVVPRLR